MWFALQGHRRKTVDNHENSWAAHHLDQVKSKSLLSFYSFHSADDFRIQTAYRYWQQSCFTGLDATTLKERWRDGSPPLMPLILQITESRVREDGQQSKSVKALYRHIKALGSWEIMRICSVRFCPQEEGNESHSQRIPEMWEVFKRRIYHTELKRDAEPA